MYFKIILAFLVVLTWMNISAECKALVQSADQTETEVDYDVSPQMPPQRPGHGRMARQFTAWMNFIKNFWNDGNWENGGPQNFANFIGDQVTKLVKALDQDKKKK